MLMRLPVETERDAVLFRFARRQSTRRDAWRRAGRLLLIGLRVAESGRRGAARRRAARRQRTRGAAALRRQNCAAQMET